MNYAVVSLRPAITQEYNFAWNYSFENHEGKFNNGGNWTVMVSPNIPNGYYALGARCAY